MDRERDRVSDRENATAVAGVIDRESVTGVVAAMDRGSVTGVAVVVDRGYVGGMWQVALLRAYFTCNDLGDGR